MTCIVGIQHPEGVTIAADSAGSDGWTISSRADTKVFRNHGYLFGFCGSFRMGQLLHYSFIPPRPPARDVERFMTTVFVDAVRECLTEGGYARTKNGVETGGTFLVGVNGHLFCVEDDYQVGRERHGFAAIGSGDEVALGSLHTTRTYTLSPRSRALAALKAAEELTTFVRGPFKVLTQHRGKA